MAKQKAPEIIRVRASLAVYGLRRGQEETVPVTEVVQTLLADGKLVRIDEPQIAAAAGRPMADAEIVAAGGTLDDGDDSL